jgi:hypothetical protein
MKLKRLWAVALPRLVRRLACAWAGHSTYATKSDGKSNLRRSPVDDFVETECHRCGKTIRAVCGLALPNLKLGSPPNSQADRPQGSV